MQWRGAHQKNRERREGEGREEGKEAGKEAELSVEGGRRREGGRNQRNFETEIRATHSVLSVKQYSLHLPSSKKPLVVFQVDRRPVVQDEVQ